MQMDDDALEVEMIIKLIKGIPGRPREEMPPYHLVGMLSWGISISLSGREIVFEWGRQCPVDYVERWASKNPGRVIWP